LKRNNRQIREDRAASIVEDAHLIYRREMEDLAMQIKRLKREQENMLDLSPTHADSLVLASDFDAKEYVTKDIEISVKIRNLEIKHELAEARYKYLFTKGES
jgi:thymidylate synthase